MTFDDGLVTICLTTNMSSAGSLPVLKLSKKFQQYFCYDTLGVQRYYTALQANQRIELVINVPDWPDISVLDIAIMEDNRQYKVQMVQPTYDEDGLKITKLSLERLVEAYDVDA